MNSDIRKLEKVCHGKLLSKGEIPTLLQKYNERFDILCQSNTDCDDDKERVNPVKQLWEKKVIRFPGHGSLPNTSLSKDVGSHFTEPKSKHEEEYLLQIGLSQSLQILLPESEDSLQ